MRASSMWIWSLVALLCQSASAATVSGVVTSEATGAPIAAATVELGYSLGWFYFTLGTTQTDVQGRYSITDPRVGEAQVKATATGFVPITSPLTMPAGSGVVTANLAMQRTATISGHVYDQMTGLPLAGKKLWAHSDSTQFLYATTTEDGSYAFAGLPPESYSLCLIDQGDVYINQCWDHVVANALVFPSNPLPINITAGQIISDIDFHLQVGATISGSLLNRRTGQPVENGQYLQILLRTGATDYDYIPLQLDLSGQYHITGLAPGNYQLVAQSNLPYYTPQLYSDIDCTGSNCDFPAGTFVTIDAGLNHRNDINFLMTPGTRIQGEVVARGTLTPIANATVELWRRNYIGLLSRVDDTYTDIAGRYAIEHINTGEHVLVFRAPTFISQRYPEVPCWIDCISGAQGGISTPEPTTVELNRVELDLGVTIAGQARLSGQTPDTYLVELYDWQGQRLGQVYADPSGAYQFPAWLPGTYFAAAGSPTECQLYRWLPCTAAVTSGTPIEAATPGTTSFADFDLFLDAIFAAGFESN
ncbi:MAG: collagen binding domain-containing protein [Lysobacterales bacterium]